MPALSRATLLDVVSESFTSFLDDVDGKLVRQWRCKYCDGVFRSATAVRLACHICKLPRRGIKICTADVPTAVSARLLPMFVYGADEIHRK